MMLSTFVFAAALLVSSVSAGKRGLAWPWYNGPLNPGIFKTSSGEVTSIYDWETYAPPSTNGNGGLTFIGMQRCMDCSSSPIAQLETRFKQQKWQTVFSLNEPDINNISPTTAAAWYITYINPMAIKKALPAVTSSTAKGQGLDWVAAMITACKGECYFDYINIHWYGENLSQFQTFVEEAHTRFPAYQLVISEFALSNPSGGATAQTAFFKAAFPWLDSQSYVKLYFPFIASSPQLNTQYGGSDMGSSLFTNAGGLSAIGQLMVA